VAPSYLPGVTNAKVSAALLQTVERLLRVDLGRAELEVTARDLEQRIEQALLDRPDLREFVDKLRAREAEEAGIVPEPDAPAEDPGELPSADAVLQDLEQYLRQLQQGDEDR
jgi:hypothetical protein